DALYPRVTRDDPLDERRSRARQTDDENRRSSLVRVRDGPARTEPGGVARARHGFHDREIGAYVIAGSALRGRARLLVVMECLIPGAEVLELLAERVVQEDVPFRRQPGRFENGAHPVDVTEVSGRHQPRELVMPALVIRVARQQGLVNAA